MFRAIALVVISLVHPPAAAPAPPTVPPVPCLAGLRGPAYNGQRMASGMAYYTVSPIVVHPRLALGTVVDIRFGGRVVRGIVLESLLSRRGVDVELSPDIFRRLGALRDQRCQVTLEVVGYEPPSRWMHAIGALNP